jgi:lysozyme
MDQHLTLSTHGLTLLQESEGLRLKAYLDSAGIWTIGYGTIRYPDGSQVQEGDVCTQEQAEYWTYNDLAWVLKAVNEMVAPQISQKMFDALCMLVYNIGETNFHKSSMLRQLNQCNWKQASIEFDKWVKARSNGKLITVGGLVNRRNREQALFDEGVKDLAA